MRSSDDSVTWREAAANVALETAVVALCSLLPTCMMLRDCGLGGINKLLRACDFIEETVSDQWPRQGDGPIALGLSLNKASEVMHGSQFMTHWADWTVLATLFEGAQDAAYHVIAVAMTSIPWTTVTMALPESSCDQGNFSNDCNLALLSLHAMMFNDPLDGHA